MAAKSKLKAVKEKGVATDIQIAAGMVTLALLSGNQEQQPTAQQPQQQGQPQGGPPQTDGQQAAPQQQGPQLPPGLEAIGQVLQGANDPAAALAHVIFIAIAKVKQALTEKGVDIDDRVWVMGGGVLDRILVEVMMAIGTILQYPAAKDPRFTHQVKSDVLDLMEDDEQNSESIKVLHKKGLPLPKPPINDQQQQQAGLAAPQGAQ